MSERLTCCIRRICEREYKRFKKLIRGRCSTKTQPAPLDREVQNGYPTAHFAAFKNQFAIIFDVNWSYEPPKRNELSFASIRDWICDTYGLEISNSSISQVKAKCHIDSLEEPGDDVCIPKLKTDKEKAVLEAFRYYNII